MGGFNICVHYKMINTVSLVTACHHTKLAKLFLIYSSYVLEETGFLHLCLSYNQIHWLPLFQIIFSKMFVYWTVLEDKDSASLQSKGQACLVSNIIKRASASRRKGSLFTSHHKRFRFPNLKIPLLLYNPL